MVSGCGGGTGTGRGKVTCGGKPVCWGSVTLLDGKGQYYQGELDSDGSFTIDKCPPGSFKVGVFSPNPADSADQRAGKAAGGKAITGMVDPRDEFRKKQPVNDTPSKPKPAPGQWFPLNAKYTEPSSSGITIEIKSGTEVHIEIPK